jgi:MOSC domain-containing protein YiiM
MTNLPQPHTVVSVSRDDRHRFSKPPVATITLLEGLGVEGDVHAGLTVQHRYLVRKDPTAPNRTQVHLMAAELFDELADLGFAVSAGEMGENITTTGIDLIRLPQRTVLHVGADAIVEITGLRSPCSLINKFQSGLMKACITRDSDGHVVRKAGIMGIVLRGGEIKPGDSIRVELPAEPHLALETV